MWWKRITIRFSSAISIGDVLQTCRFLLSNREKEEPRQVPYKECEWGLALKLYGCFWSLFENVFLKCSTLDNEAVWHILNCYFTRTSAQETKICISIVCIKSKAKYHRDNAPAILYPRCVWRQHSFLSPSWSFEAMLKCRNFFSIARQMCGVNRL